MNFVVLFPWAIGRVIVSGRTLPYLPSVTLLAVSGTPCGLTESTRVVFVNGAPFVRGGAPPATMTAPLAGGGTFPPVTIAFLCARASPPNMSDKMENRADSNFVFMGFPHFLTQNCMRKDSAPWGARLNLNAVIRRVAKHKRPASNEKTSAEDFRSTHPGHSQRRHNERLALDSRFA